MSARGRSVEERLVSVGRSPVPAPRAAFADGLEERLRAVRDLALEPSPPLPATRPRRSFVGLGVVGSAVAALAFVLAGGSTTPLQVQVASATDTLVVLPDGTVAEVAPGLIVPDGARLVTGDGGRMVAGEVELGPNREATVDGGTLRPSERLPVGTVPRPKGTSPSPVATPGPATGEPRTAGDKGEPRQDPPAPAIGPSDSQDPSKPTGPESDPDPVTRKPDRVQPKPAAGELTTTTTTAPQHSQLRLRARRQDDAVRLDWSPYEGQGFAAYLVLRSDGGAEPRYPLDRRTTVVARLSDQHASGYLDALERSDGYLYRVVAVDDQRRMLARTPAIAPVGDDTRVGGKTEESEADGKVAAR
ncbi:MAG: hypothetical protein ACRDV9_04030 [Acidimicrobiia bacterium]